MELKINNYKLVYVYNYESTAIFIRWHYIKHIMYCSKTIEHCLVEIEQFKFEQSVY